MHKYQQYRERAAAAVEARNVIRKACEIYYSTKFRYGFVYKSLRRPFLEYVYKRVRQ